MPGVQLLKRSGWSGLAAALLLALVWSVLTSGAADSWHFGVPFILLGVWVCLGTLTPAIVVPIFVWLMTRFIRVEEASLKEQFGDAYVNYCDSVRRCI